MTSNDLHTGDQLDKILRTADAAAEAALARQLDPESVLARIRATALARRPAQVDQIAESTPIALKVLIAGGFGVGKTTLVGSVSEIKPLQTEEYLTNDGIGLDDIEGAALKHTTTVAMDFGRMTIRDDLVIYLFGTPGQDRFWFVWDELASGAVGAVVLADPRRLADCFPSVDYFERRGTPFIIAVNCFDDAPRQFRPDEVQLALNLDPHVPVMFCDARSRRSSTDVLIALVEHVMRLRGLTPQPAGIH